MKHTYQNDEPDFSIIDEDVSFTPLQGIKAMKARVDGEWDNRQLMKLGPLSDNEDQDIRRILNCIHID